MPKTPDEPFDNIESITDPLAKAQEALVIEVQRLEENPPPRPRFVAALSPLSRHQSELWFVFDTELNITVFHWFGRTAQTKTNVVAQALNVLGHQYE